MKKIKWCFLVKGGLRIVEPSKEVAFAYLEEAEKALSKVKELIEEGDFVWASARIYYCAYYSLYSFLQRIGVKSGNHDCSIELVDGLLNKDFISDILNFKQSRIDSQYYLKIGQKEKLLEFYLKVKNFYLEFKEIVGGLTEQEIEGYINKIREVKDEI